VKMLLWSGFLAILLSVACGERLSSYDGTPSDDPSRVANKEVGNKSMNEKAELKLATFGSGCFWCTEAIFERLHGVEKVISGYSGGHVENPTYEQVCTGMTHHAEVV